MLVCVVCKLFYLILKLGEVIILGFFLFDFVWLCFSNLKDIFFLFVCCMS